MIVFIVIFLIISIILLISICNVKSQDAKFTLSVLFFTCGILIGGALCDFNDPSEPQAIDVYRGNTTLEINRTFRDSLLVKSDTIVIFNNKIK